MVFIFELTFPGTWLNSENREWAFKIRGLIQNLQTQFTEACVALNLFSSCLVKQQMHQPPMDNWEKDFNRRREIMQQLESEVENRYDINIIHRLYYRTELIMKKEKWASGILPQEYDNAEILLHAKLFLYALDGFDKLLKVLSEEEGVPPVLTDIYKRFGDEFESLRGIRNTAQHIEDRARGLGKNNKTLELKPIQNDFINAPNGGVLMLNCLNGTKYGNTMADGHYGEVDVSPDSMSKVQVLFQELLDSFQWTGPMSHYPS